MKNSFKLPVFFVLFLTFYGWSQNQKPILQEFQQKFIQYETENKLDSINFLINVYLERDNLFDIEKQLLFYYKGIHYTKINRYQEAIMAFRNSINFEKDNAKSQLIKNVTFYFIADAYFTLKEYKKAYIYAEKSKNYLNLETYPDAYIDAYSIIGYYYFLQLEYDKSLENYIISNRAATKYNKCKVSEIDVKIARILSRKKDFYNAKQTIEKAIKISDSCHEEVNKLNALKCLREILVENEKFEEAQKTFNDIENLTSSIETKQRDKKIDSLETLFKTKIKEEQNKVLKKSNLEKEQNIKAQKLALFGTIFGIIILLSLLIFIYRISKQQKQTNKKLERLNLLNQKIFSVISHDFKGPITTLKLLLNNKNTIQDENPAISMYMNDIKNQLDQSDVMLDNLLEWAKNELLINKIAKQKIAIHDFVIANCTENKLKILEKNITIDNNIPQNTTIEFNESVLKIVFRNILNNAVKFSYEGSKIEINWTNNSLEIVDYGKGIDDEKLKSLFKKNINPGLGTNMETGFGIGLYLSNELMVKNGGNITVKKNKIGSSFSICFK